MEGDGQARLKRLASKAVETDIARIVEKARLHGPVGSAIMGTSTLRPEVALASEACRSLGFQADIYGTVALRERVLGNLQHLQHSDYHNSLQKIRSQLEPLRKKHTGSLFDALQAHQWELADPFLGLRSEMEQLTKSLRGPDLREIVPRFASIAEQVSQLAQPDNVASKRWQELVEQLAGITKPWSTVGNEMASIAAAVRLSKLGTLSRELPAFSKDRATLKTIEFGQFDRVMPFAERLEDESESETVYSEAGRNPALVAFPSEGYDEVLTATGWVLDIKPPEFIRPDGTLLPQATIDRNDHLIINMIEGHLKAKIATTLIASGGMSAVKRLFGNRLPNWERKRDEALKKGEQELHLIYYSDFMEIAEIVPNTELWESTFKAVFQRKDRFRMTIERLHGLRITTSHSRPLTRTGKLRLYAEAIELFEAISVIPIKH